MLKKNKISAFQNKILSFALTGIAATTMFTACNQAADVITSTDAGSKQTESEIAARRNKTTQPAPVVDTTTNTTTTGGSTTTGATAPATYNSTINWSGMTWNVRNSSSYTGPGLNVFSNSSQNVWVDNLGQLHLKITYTNGRWVSAEVSSQQSFGYGDYVFYTASKADQIDKNAVFGMFTWNNNSFQTDANSEIDIEITRWGIDGSAPLEYSVQPTAYDAYKERCFYPSNFLLTGDYSTHGFNWRPEGVAFNSYYDWGYPTANKAGAFSFMNPTIARTKSSGGMTSDPVLVPKPGTSTKVHINLWLHDTNRDGYGDAPSNGQTVEVVLKKFEYKPYVAA